MNMLSLAINKKILSDLFRHLDGFRPYDLRFTTSSSMFEFDAKEIESTDRSLRIEKGHPGQDGFCAVLIGVSDVKEASIYYDIDDLEDYVEGAVDRMTSSLRLIVNTRQGESLSLEVNTSGLETFLEALY